MRLPLLHRVGLLGLLLLTGCAAMHKQHVANMKANGDPRAPCYEACGPSDSICMKQCDNDHRAAASARGSGGVDREAALRLLTAAAQEDEARKKEAAAAAGKDDASSASSSPAPRSAKPSNVTASETKRSSPPSPTECRPECEVPRKCMVYLKGTTQCAAGGTCWTVDRDHAECK